MVCQQCNATVRDNATFCQKCGCKIQAPIIDDFFDSETEKLLRRLSLQDDLPQNEQAPPMPPIPPVRPVRPDPPAPPIASVIPKIVIEEPVFEEPIIEELPVEEPDIEEPEIDEPEIDEPAAIEPSDELAQNAAATEDEIDPNDFAPTVGQYIGWFIICNIPVIGWLIAFCIAVSSPNKAKARFFAAHLILIISVAVIGLLARTLFEDIVSSLLQELIWSLL